MARVYFEVVAAIAEEGELPGNATSTEFDIHIPEKFEVTSARVSGYIIPNDRAYGSDRYDFVVTVVPRVEGV